METTTKQNITKHLGDGEVLVQDYTQKIQYRTFRRSLKGYGTVQALVRFDDNCANGHCDLSVTGQFWEEGRRHYKGEPDECGCIHERIVHVFPELQQATDFHLCGTKGPMHYVANVVYLAGDRDCHGFVRNAVEFSTGKPRELDGARRVAIWPEATDEQLSVPKEELTAALEARLPEILNQLRVIVEGLGFDYDFPTKR